MVESSRLVFKLLCVKLKSLNFDFIKYVAHWCFRVLHVSFEFPTKTALFSILQSCLIVVTITQTVKIEWAVKGYHHFRSRPHPDIGLLSSSRKWKSI